MNGPCGSFRCFKENTATTAFWWTAPWLWRQPGCSEQSRVAVTARPILYRRQFCLIKPWMHFPLLPSMFLRMTVSFRILKNKLFLPNRDVFFVCPPGLEWPDVVSGHWTSCFLFFFLSVFNVDSCLEVHSCLFLSPWASDGWSWLAFGELGLSIESIWEHLRSVNSSW